MIGSERVGLVHARSRAPAWSALLAARRMRVPFVTTYHGAYRETNKAKRLYNGVMARGDMVIANSAFTANLIAQRYGTPAERIVVIHRGVDTRRFDPAAIAPERISALRRAWGIDASTAVVLLAGRLTAWKGQRVLIEAASRLKQAGQLAGATVVLAGDAQGRHGYVSELQRQVADAGLGGDIHFAGHVEDVPAAFLTAHVAVVASTEPEAFGRVAIEAAAMGCPVIATAIGAPPETVVTDGENATGWLVPPGDAQALSRTLSQALALDTAARAAMGARARRHVLAQFTVEALQQRTLAVYDTLLATTLGRRFAETSASTQESPSLGSRGPA